MADPQGGVGLDEVAERPGWRPARVLRIVVGVSLLAYLVSRLDLGVSLDVVAGARLDLLALAMAVFFGIRLLAAYRWLLLLRGRQLQVTFASVLRLIFVSGFVGYFTPGGVGIELAKLYGLARTTTDLALAL